VGANVERARRGEPRQAGIWGRYLGQGSGAGIWGRQRSEVSHRDWHGGGSDDCPRLPPISPRAVVAAQPSTGRLEDLERARYPVAHQATPSMLACGLAPLQSRSHERQRPATSLPPTQTGAPQPHAHRDGNIAPISRDQSLAIDTLLQYAMLRPCPGSTRHSRRCRLSGRPRRVRPAGDPPYREPSR